MIVICEKCGKKYRVDPVKIKGKAASFNCHVCSHVIMVIKARVTPPQPDSKMKTRSAITTVEQLTDDINAGTRHRRKAGGSGQRAKMIPRFFYSIITHGRHESFYLRQIETASRLPVQESVKIVAQRDEGKKPAHSAATEIERVQQLP